MSTHNIGFYGDLTKIIFELSSNTHLISSADQPSRPAHSFMENCFPLWLIPEEQVVSY